MNRQIATIGAIFATFFWASAFVVGSSLVANESATMIAAERFIVASIVILIYMFYKEKNHLSTFRRNIIPYIVLGIIGVTGLNTAMFIGLKTTTSTNEALILALTPVVSSILSSILNKTKILKNQGIGMVISFVGVAVVLSKGSLENIMHLKFTSGDLIMIGGLLCWSIYNVSIHKYIKESTPLQTSSYTMFFGALGLIVVALLTNNNIYYAVASQSNHIFLALLYLGVIGTVLAYLCWVNGTHVLGAHNISIYFNLVPIFVVLIGILSGKFPNALVLIGTLLVIAGVIISTGSYKNLFKSKGILVNKDQKI